MTFGEFSEFECRVNTTYHGQLELFIGTSVNKSAQIHPEQLSRLNAMEFSANITRPARNESVGKVWIVMNSNTIQIVKYFFCKVFSINNRPVITSRKAYISIIYPECTPALDQLTYTSENLDHTSSVQPTPSQSHLEQQPLQLMSSAIILEPCKHELSISTQSYKLYCSFIIIN